MTTYHAQVERGDRFWLVHLPEIERTTQARHLREVEAMARDLVAVMQAVEPDSFDLEVEISMPPSVQAHLEKSRAMREAATRANSSAAEESRAAARELAAQGLSVRDIGQMLGVSFQRAHQLVS